MGAGVTGLILLSVLVTAFISGIFGMAGGLILMGVLTATLPVATAMILHGAVQLVSNGWRAFLLRQHISWPVLGRYLIGGIPAFALLLFVVWRPDKPAVFLMLGVMAFVPWLPKRIMGLDVNRRFQAEALGFVAQTLNTLAGIVGPVLDVFFIRSEMTRQEIVATKGATQVVAHLTKIVIWSMPALAAQSQIVFPPLWLIAVAVPISMVGTWLGGLVLHRMSDISFRDWTKWILSVIGLVYIARGFGLG